jgi:hypothetical protein
MPDTPVTLDPELAERAIARWLAHGPTSRTHPVLRTALVKYFHPLGIDAEYLETEPFSAIESGFGSCWLGRPQWHPERMEAAHPARPDFEPIIRRPLCYRVAIEASGVALIDLTAEGRDDPVARAEWEFLGYGWNAARHTLQAAQEAERFIHTAAGLLLSGDPLTAVYAEGNDDAFCRGVEHRCSSI